jgi:hypothetical protein
MPNNKDFAVVIGVDDYKQLPPLKGPINDANAFKAWLLNPAGGDVPEANCKFIPSTHPYRPIQDEIDDALEEIIMLNDGSFRRFYFFFAGHGIGISWDANGLCLPKWSEVQRNYALSSKGYVDYIVGSSIFQEIYFFLDCCRLRAINANPMIPRLGNIRPRGGGIPSVVIYASPFENAAGEAPSDEESGSLVRGFFSQALVEGLSGAAAGISGNITVKDLIDFTRQRTTELAKAVGKVQLVNAEIVDGGRNIDTLTIISGVTPIVTSVTIRFGIAGTMRLSDSQFHVLVEEFANAGNAWSGQQLTRGIYSIQHLDSGKKDYFEVSGTEKSMEYEFN